MKPKFEPFSEVKVIHTEQFQDLIGKVGAVLGIAIGENEVTYAVALDGVEITYSFAEANLVATGKKRDSKDYYDPDMTIRVSPQGDIL
jgi:hypothetical protein